MPEPARFTCQRLDCGPGASSCGRPDCAAPAPQRLQRSRAAGWRMPAGAVYVGRPSLWGNPFQGDDAAALYADWLRGRFTLDLWLRRGDGDSPERYRRILAGLPWLRGHHLVCWCAPGTPCHGDLLLELANA